MLELFLTIVLLYADTQCVYSTIGKVAGYARMRDYLDVPWNGFGSNRLVLSGEAQIPTQYRVLVPLLCALWPRSKGWYLAVKGVGILFALSSFEFFCNMLGLNGTTGMILLAAVFPMMLIYDYADTYFEFGFLALAYGLMMMGGQELWLVLITFLATLNRETGVLIPIGYWALTGGVIGALLLLGVAATGYILPRAYYGTKDRNCPFNMLSRNIKELKISFEHFFFLAYLLALIGVGIVGTPLPTPFYWMMVLFFIAISIPALWREVRVYNPVLLVIIPAILTKL